MNTQSEVILDMQLKTQLKKLIQERGVTIATLSRGAKTSPQNIHNWISGATPKSIDAVKRVADYFDVSLDFLLYGPEAKAQTKNVIQEHEDEINAGIFEIVMRRVRK